MLARADLIAALRLRYDHYSAEAVFEAALGRCGLADQPAYSPAELTQFRTALAKVGDRLDRVYAFLDDEMATPAATPAPVVKVAEKAPEKPAAKVEAKPAAGKPTETVVLLTGVDAPDDDVVLMCGGSPELGDWEPAQACEMKRADDQWTATLRLPADAAIEFKFVRRAADGTVTWERGDNRTLEATPRVETTWR